MLRSGGLLLPALLSLSLLGCAARGSVRTVPGAADSARRIAVLPFDSGNPYIPGTILSDYFTVQILQNIPALHVIERKDLIKILQEQKLNLTGVTRADKFARLGSILGVDAILIGSVHTLETIQSVGGSIAVTVKLMDVTSGRILWADNEKVSVATWSSREVTDVAEILMEKSARKMVERLERNLGGEIAVRRMDAQLRLIHEARLNAADPE